MTLYDWFIVLVAYLGIGNAVTAPIYLRLRDGGALDNMTRGHHILSYLVTVVLWWWTPRK